MLALVRLLDLSSVVKIASGIETVVLESSSGREVKPLPGQGQSDIVGSISGSGGAKCLKGTFGELRKAIMMGSTQ